MYPIYEYLFYFFRISFFNVPLILFIQICSTESFHSSWFKSFWKDKKGTKKASSSWHIRTVNCMHIAFIRTLRNNEWVNFEQWKCKTDLNLSFPYFIFIRFPQYCYFIFLFFLWYTRSWRSWCRENIIILFLLLFLVFYFVNNVVLLYIFCSWNKWRIFLNIDWKFSYKYSIRFPNILRTY